MAAIDLDKEFAEEYPVNFKSGGDTTKDAFWKHIQEIKRIYGILNALNAASASSSGLGGVISEELKKHVESSNPHPNWKLKLSDLSGELDASRVSGQLTKATIDASRVNGLSAVIGGQVPEMPDLNEVFPSSKLKSTGYIKLINGLMIQWGSSDELTEVNEKYSFPEKFANDCFVVLGTLTKASGPVGGDAIRMIEWDKEGFKCQRYTEQNGYGVPFVFIAIGN